MSLLAIFFVDIVMAIFHYVLTFYRHSNGLVDTEDNLQINQ